MNFDAKQDLRYKITHLSSSGLKLVSKRDLKYDTSDQVEIEEAPIFRGVLSALE